jgi:hypothetical protein
MDLYEEAMSAGHGSRAAKFSELLSLCQVDDRRDHAALHAAGETMVVRGMRVGKGFKGREQYE